MGNVFACFSKNRAGSAIECGYYKKGRDIIIMNRFGVGFLPPVLCFFILSIYPWKLVVSKICTIINCIGNAVDLFFATRWSRKNRPCTTVFFSWGSSQFLHVYFFPWCSSQFDACLFQVLFFLIDISILICRDVVLNSCS